jgi:hypothetical protein
MFRPPVIWPSSGRTLFSELAVANYTTGVYLRFFPHVGNKENLDVWKHILTVILKNSCM